MDASGGGKECCQTDDDVCQEVTAGRNARETEWQAAWYDGDCKNANREVSKWLKDHMNKLTGGKSGCRILVPMCGAARDMHWLMEQGHTVIGIELVEKALRMFLDRHGIEYDESDVPGTKDGKCYKSKDGQVTLYRCNIFDMDMSLIGKVDGVWDSGAMTDIPPAERLQYSEIILSALSPGGRILAETFTFGEIKGGEDGSGHDHHHSSDHHHGEPGTECQHGDGDEDNFDFPCRPVEMQDFERMYGARCTIEMLDEKDSEECEELGPNWWSKDRLHVIIVGDKGSVDESTSGSNRKRGAEEGIPEDTASSKKAKEEEEK